jgi:hypothetical protein
MDRGRVGEDRGSKETDGCPLTVAETMTFTEHVQRGTAIQQDIVLRWCTSGGHIYAANFTAAEVLQITNGEIR